MFGYLAQAFNYLARVSNGPLQESLCGEEERDSSLTNGENTCSTPGPAVTACDTINLVGNCHSEICCNDDSRLKKSFDGIITSFFNNRGLVDDHVYFTISVVLANEKPKVGDSVHVVATRSHALGGWIAKQVTITNGWGFGGMDEDDGKPYQDKVLASVVDCNDGIVSLKADDEFHVSLKKFKVGFIPYRGDWVQVDILIGGSDRNFSGKASLLKEEQIISVNPLREKGVVGVVTQLLRGYGFIDDDIFFPFSVCAKGKRLQVGDPVFACIVESHQKKGEWRATYVCLKQSIQSQSQTNADSPLSQSLLSLDDIYIPADLNFGSIHVGSSKDLEIRIQ